MKMICPSYNICNQQCGLHYKVHEIEDDCESECCHFKNADGLPSTPCISATKFIRKKKLKKLNKLNYENDWNAHQPFRRYSGLCFY